MHEILRIESESKLNSKSKWRGPAKPRLKVDKSDWMSKIVSREKTELEKAEMKKIELFKSRFGKKNYKSMANIDRKVQKPSKSDLWPEPIML